MTLKYILLILALLVIQPLCGDDFDSLLDDYKQASDLSNKTKDEAVGNLIVYTRDDIERMQANTLKDILKSMRFFSYQENRLGRPDLINTDPLVSNSASIRIYLNEHELNGPLFGSGFISFGDIELDFIDHLEIYQGFPTFDFGTEPATIVVRLYSKTAKHDSGGKLKGQLGTYGSNILSSYIAEELEDISYFAYASRREEQRKDRYYNSHSLQRDKRTERVYLSLSSDNHHLELHGSHSKSNGFLGNSFSIDSPLAQPGSTDVPSDTMIRNRYLSLSLHSTLQNKTLDLTASVMKSLQESSFEYNPSLSYRPNPAPLGQLQINSLNGQVKEDSYTLGLTKKLTVDDHIFSTGLKFRHNHFDLTELNPDASLFSGIPIPLSLSTHIEPYTSTDIYAAFVQDEYTIDENQIVTLSVMLERYHNKHTDIEDKTLFQSRFGYIFTNVNWISKTFLTHEEFAPEPYQVVIPSAQYANPNLKESSYLSFLQELSYQTESTQSKLILGYNKTKDFAVPDELTLQLKNNEADLNVLLFGLEESITFNDNDKLEIQAYVLALDTNGTGNYVSSHGLQVRMLNTIDKFDLFNELIIREKESSLSHNGHDYNLGVIYHVTDDLQFNLKGENLFDNSSQQDYLTKINSITQEQSYITAPINDRRIWLGMELLF